MPVLRIARSAVARLLVHAEAVHHTVVPRRGRCLLAVLVFVLVVGACADDSRSLGPADRPDAMVSASDVAEELVRPVAVGVAARPHTIRDEFAAMSGRVPGGFGGLLFDEDGVLTVVLVDPASHVAARAVLENEPLVRARRDGPNGARFAVQGARIRQGEYSYGALHDWYETLLVALDITPTQSGISVRRNRVVVGIAKEEHRANVDAAIRDAGIPREAVAVELVADVHLLNSVTDRHRPVPGGVRNQWRFTHWFFGDTTVTCTIGPNVLRLGQRGFVVPSHCTRNPRQVDWNDITHYWQALWHQWPSYPGSSINRIGNEAIDPSVFPCSLNPDFGCRHSDAALGLYRDVVEFEYARIARPASRNTGALSLSSSNPRFFINSAWDWSVDGEVLEKVGQTTGWSGGQVVDGCINITPASGGTPTGPTMLCQMIVDAFAKGGDSGSPVFRIIYGGSVELRGMVWAGISTPTVSCSVHPDNLMWCPNFIASNLGGILEVGAGATLHFYHAGGGGDPGDPPGNPPCPDPNDPDCYVW